MKRPISIYVVVLAMLIFAKSNLKAQDIHFSQFYNSPLNINPALTGIFNGDVRVIGSMRDQWRNVSVPYLTFSGNYDMKLYPKKSTKSFFGLGGIFNYDNAGDGNYNMTDINITGSYSYLLTPKHVLTGGLLVGYASEGVTIDGDLTWDNFWTGELIDPALGSGETLNPNERFNYLETGAGINYRFQKSQRTNLNIGVGAFHLVPPDNTFFPNGDTKLPMRIAVSGVGTFKIIKPLDIQIHGLANLQDQYSEYVAGGLVRLHLNQNRGKEAALDLGATVRVANQTGIAFLAPTAAIHLRQWYVGFNYDVNFSQYVSDFDLRSGGPEIHVRYIITKVKPLSEEKTCPIF